MVLGHFAETKGPRPPGRNPAKDQEDLAGQTILIGIPSFIE